MLTVTYEFYYGIYCGRMSREDFDRLAIYASAYLDELTMGRTAGEIPAATEERVKMALCAVADAYLLQEHGGGVASETNDGISVTYVAGISNAKTDGRRLMRPPPCFLGPPGSSIGG